MAFPVWFNDLHLPFLEASVARGIPYNPDNVKCSSYAQVDHDLTFMTGRREQQWIVHWNVLH